MDDDVSPFATVLRKVANADHDVVEMVNGTPDWPPPTPLRSGLKQAADGEPAEFQYAPTRGLRPLRQELAERRSVPADSIIVTAGATEANQIVMAHALSRSSGQEVVMAEPFYPYYPRRTRRLGGTPVTVPVRSDGVLDPQDVADVTGPETAAIVVNTPNNPTGSVYAEEVLRSLVEIAETCDAILLSDETYGHVDLSGSFVSALTIESSHRIVTSSVSKSMAVTGLRLGYLSAPEPHRGPLADRHELTTISASRPIQRAVLQSLQETDPDYYESVRERLRDRRRTFTNALDTLGATYTMPDMGFYVLAKIPGLPGTMDTVTRLIEDVGVAPMPGAAFGDSRSEWLRFALVTPRVETAAQRLSEAVDGTRTEG